MTSGVPVENKKKLIAIQQPTFLPWVGWFDIADQADLLLILDDVAFSKQSWQQRNRVRTPRGLEYVTVPIRTAGRLGQPILEAEIAETNFAARLERTISTNYARTPYYGKYYPTFCEVLRASAASGSLSALNIGLIGWFFDAMEIKTPFHTCSKLNIHGKRGDYVAALCEAVMASDYLSPVGSEAYLLEDRHAFDRRDIKVWMHEYRHPEYRQSLQPFIPFASTLDLLFNEGPRALDIIRSGRRTSRSLGVHTAASIGDEHDPR